MSDTERQLQDQIEELEERIRQLEKLLVPDWEMPLGLDLPLREVKVVRALMSREVLTREHIYDMFYSHYVTDDLPDYADKIIDVTIHRLRKKLQVFNLNIHSVRRIGYTMPNEDRARLRSGNLELTIRPREVVAVTEVYDTKIVRRKVRAARTAKGEGKWSL